ncbi:MAG: O-methyltransferase [Gemmatimonadaceae bacterium]
MKKSRPVRPRTKAKIWSQVDEYICDKLLADDKVLDTALKDSDAAGLPAIAVTPAQGKFLQILAEMIGARSVLEIGTLGGYSTIWFARALPPDGHIITLEVDPTHADVARKNFARAGLQRMIELRLGAALDTLPLLVAEQSGPFDLIFIDADKTNIPAYFDWAMKLSRPGSLIIVDNVVRDGGVVDAKSKDPSIQGVRRFIDQLARDKRVTATAIQTVGSKGYDGFAIARVR